ncbi:hypothetical protein [Chamaesiphon sp.]
MSKPRVAVEPAKWGGLALKSRMLYIGRCLRWRSVDGTIVGV